MSTNVGQQLREARQSKNLTLEQVSRLTHIRPHHLEALEAGNLDALPSRTQARGFVRTYAVHLGLDPDPLVARLDAGGEPAAPPPPPEPDPAGSYATDLYQEIGDTLRIQRETLGVTLDEAEKQTRLRRHHLEAIERGDLNSLPSPVQGRGMLHNYAAFLGLDPEPLLLKFAEALQSGLAERRQAAEGRPGARRAPWRGLVSGDLLFGGVFLLGLIVFVIWAVGRVTALQASETAQATAPAIVDVLDPLPTETPTPTIEPLLDTTTSPTPQEVIGEEVSPTPVPTQPVSNDAPVQVYIVVIQRAWMQVTVDGQVEFEGRVIPGSAFPFSGREEIKVLTSSGSALEIFYNQQDQGPMGLFGQIVERIYTSSAILIPTPEESPTPTPTLTTTPDPALTPTPTATP